MEHLEDGKVYKGKNFDRWRKDNVDLIESMLTHKKCRNLNNLNFKQTKLAVPESAHLFYQ
jgi:hypothetical protein